MSASTRTATSRRKKAGGYLQKAVKSSSKLEAELEEAAREKLEELRENWLTAKAEFEEACWNDTVRMANELKGEHQVIIKDMTKVTSELSRLIAKERGLLMAFYERLPGTVSVSQAASLLPSYGVLLGIGSLGVRNSPASAFSRAVTSAGVIK